jgi:hypothetical protein
MCVHEFSYDFIFETFPFHHMAPVTRRISYGQQYGFALALCQVKCVFAPGIPVYGVVSVLYQVRAGLVGKMVTHKFNGSLVREIG